MRQSLLGLLAAAAVTIGPIYGAASQGNPSADDIVKSLQPKAGFTSTSRGIRALSPAESQDPASREARKHGRSQYASRPTGTATDAAPSVNLTVQFPSNSAELTPAAARTLDELGRALSSPSLASFRFRIEGHTDTVGTPEANKTLSDHRATTVADYLVQKFNVDRARLVPAGMGEDGLLVATGPQVAEPRNRRVLVINLGS